MRSDFLYMIQSIHALVLVCQMELLHVEGREGLCPERLGCLAGEDRVIGGGPLPGPPPCLLDELLHALWGELLAK